jgi:hypothetical protein
MVIHAFYETFSSESTLPRLVVTILLRKAFSRRQVHIELIIGVSTFLCVFLDIEA